MIAPEIRVAAAGDLAGLLALFRHLHPTDPEPEPAAAEAAWSSLLSSACTRVIVAEVEGRVVSSCTLALIPNLTRGARPYGVIENVVTHRDRRRAGLGRAVLEHALALARESGCYKVTLATGSRQEATLRFYEQAGFTRGGKTHFEARWP